MGGALSLAAGRVQPAWPGGTLRATPSFKNKQLQLQAAGLGGSETSTPRGDAPATSRSLPARAKTPSPIDAKGSKSERGERKTSAASRAASAGGRSGRGSVDVITIGGGDDDDAAGDGPARGLYDGPRDSGAGSGVSVASIDSSDEKGLAEGGRARWRSYLDWYREGGFKGDVTPPEPDAELMAQICSGGGWGKPRAHLAPPEPENEEARLRAVWALRILDTDVDASFDALTELTAETFDVPIAIVTIVDHDRQWFKSERGVGCRETGRDVSFCGHSILLQRPEVLVVRDATKDWRFKHNPLVTGPTEIRFYAGAPIRLDNGANIGTLCIIDRKPREFGPDAQRRLIRLTAIVKREIELYGAARELAFRSATEASIAAFSRLALAAPDLDDTLRAALAAVSGTVGADFAFLARAPESEGRGAGALPGLVRRGRGGAVEAAADGVELGTLARLADEAPDGAALVADARPFDCLRPAGARSGVIAAVRYRSAAAAAAATAGPAAAAVHSQSFRGLLSGVPMSDSARSLALAGALDASGSAGARRSRAASAAASRPDSPAPASELLPFCYIGVFSSDERRSFGEDVRAYVASFGAALEAAAAQWRARRALQESERQLRLAKERAERLIRNTLPEAVAERLMADNSPLAELYEHTSIVFADIVGFTALSEKLAPAEVAEMLNRIFSCLDHACARTGCEKIKTIGDCYMAAAGVPARRADHAAAAVEFAIAAVSAMRHFNAHFGTDVAVRVGIHSGPVAAGVIGSTRYNFDLWGDTVNIASRMESSGVAGRVQVSEATHELVKGDYDWECRGPRRIKGKAEEMTTYLLAGRLPADGRGAPTFEACAVERPFWHMELRRASFLSKS